MPTYEYACTSCGQHLEVFQAFSDAPLTTCPNCGGDLRKVFGSIGIVLKGSGFYRTDSRSSSSGRAGGAKDAKDAKEKKDTDSGPAAASAGDSAGSSGSGSSSSSAASDAAPSSSSSSPASKTAAAG